MDNPINFEIKAERIKSALSEDKSFYWFYVSLHIEQKGTQPFTLADIELVEYHLLDRSFPEPNKRITNPNRGFEYRFWLFGFIEVSADVVLRSARIVRLPATPISWDVTKDEIEKNGVEELTWNQKKGR